jgi:23S rRNA (adenine2503-C2)-methyltransferase
MLRTPCSRPGQARANAERSRRANAQNRPSSYNGFMQHILDAAPTAIAEWLKTRGHAGYRAAQIRKWIFEKRVGDFSEMSDLPKKLRDELATDWQLWTGEIAKHQQAPDGTEKLLLQWPDGGRIECVLLRDGDRRSICISTQVGCAMGCVFCASGLDGVDRNLTTGEIVEQMLRLQRLLPAEERIAYIVVMGMGEPLANLDHLMPALDIASSETGLGIGHRRITISTVGLPKQLDRLSETDPRYHLAVSLHAPNDELRTQIVPINKSIGLDEVLAAADRYFDKSGRRLTFEYVLLAGLNDQPEHAHQLVNILRTRTALLNVIPYNPVAGLPYQTPSGNAINRFRDILIDGGVNVKFRQKKGGAIDAACGQLRRSTPAVVQISG